MWIAYRMKLSSTSDILPVLVEGTKEYKGRTDSNTLTGPNEAVCPFGYSTTIISI